MITIHDIKANGKTYILEWTHSDSGDGCIAITETFDEENNAVDCEHEIYDFKEIL